MSFPASKGRQVKPRKDRGHAVRAVRPQLTSLIDIMIVFVVFLIQTFSMEETAMNIPKDVQLPISTAKKPPKAMVVLVVSQNALVVEGEALADVPELLKTDDLLIPSLYKWLEHRRSLTESIAKYSTSTKFKGDIAIEGDRAIPFKLIQKIMYTCGRVGFNNFALAVVQKE